ncbi:hypothetical protein O181_054875 [Austropuccinia psidii MF-1]|uniref:Uncharacterized protein n=1 Tax=Austropuccinia psidii MF-1 TaxID=1389203 RepID=A0A9Q3E395_9BASI|nr:hypothetical protein [Austropuccinia psidii MF-1]
MRQLYTSEALACKGINQRTEKAFPEPEALEEDTLDVVVDGKTLREIMPTLPLAFQLNRNLNLEDWKDIDQVLQLHQLLKDLFQCSIDNKRSTWHPTGKSLEEVARRFFSKR